MASTSKHSIIHTCNAHHFRVNRKLILLVIKMTIIISYHGKSLSTLFR